MGVGGGSQWGRVVEGQIRWTRGAWSLGAGVQSTSSEEAFSSISYEGPDGSFASQSDYDVSTLGFFLEPRFVLAVFSDRFGLYVFGRGAMSRISENESGTRPAGQVLTGCCDTFTPFPPSPEAYSLEVTRTSFAASGGPGLLIRLTSHVNLDLGVTAGFNSWGEADPRVEPDFTGWNPGSRRAVLGGWVGLVIGIG